MTEDRAGKLFLQLLTDESLITTVISSYLNRQSKFT